MSEPKIKTDLTPTKVDYLSAVLCGLSGLYLKESFVNNAVEQFASNLVAKNIAVNTGIEDTAPDALIKEYDFYTSSLRGGYSAFAKRNNKRIALDSARSIVSNISARLLLKASGSPIGSPSPTPEPPVVDPIPPPSSDLVRLFNYGPPIDRDWFFNTVGNYDLGDMEAVELQNDMVDVVEVLQDGYRLTIYEHSGFGGASSSFTKADGAVDLISLGIRDWTSSFKIESI